MPAPTQWLAPFQVNTGTAATGDQSAPQSIGLSNGNILVVWEDGTSGAIGSGFGPDIIAALYDPQGTLITAPFQLNTARSNGDQTDFDISATADGGFSMVYRSQVANFASTTREIIYESYNSSGVSIASSVITSTNLVENNLYGPQLNTSSSSTDVHVTWINSGSDGTDILGARISPTGAVLAPLNFGIQGSEDIVGYGAEIRVGDNLFSLQLEDDGTQLALVSRLLQANGNAPVTTTLFTVSSPNTALPPELAARPDGSFVMAINVNDGIQALGLSATGQFLFPFLGAPIPVVPGTTGSIVGLLNNDFVLGWQDAGSGAYMIQTYSGASSNPGQTIGSPQMVFATVSGPVELELTADGRVLVSALDAAGEVQLAIYDTRDPMALQADLLDNSVSPFVNTEVVVGTLTDALITGDLDANTLLAQNGDDVANGQAGDDTLFGARGRDTLSGGDDNDLVQGSGGRDSLSGDAGDDTLDGGKGNDTMIGGAGFDELNGDGGNDSMRGNNNDDTLRGGAGEDTLFGDNGNDQVIGNLRADWLEGGSGNDTLRGGEGRDTLIGGADDDEMRGEIGADTFVFADGWGNDRIFDFDEFNNAEKIDLSGVTAITDYADLTANHMTQMGFYVLIEDGAGNTLRIDGAQLADLNPIDFLF